MLSFVRSGDAVYSGRLNAAGAYGYGWTLFAYPNSTIQYTYNLLFSLSEITVDNNANRWFGFPLRCLVR